jgi:hypothetical protein
MEPPPQQTDLMETQPRTALIPSPPHVRLTPQKKRAVLLVVLGTLLLSSILLGIAFTLDDSSGATKIKGLATATATLTFTPSPTATIDPTSVISLGVPAGNFTQKFGPAVASYDHDATFTGTVQKANVRISIFLVPGQDNTQYVSIIHIEPQDGQSWDANSALDVVGTFLPLDAMYLRDHTMNGNTYHVFHSNALAQVFPAQAFLTFDESPATPGDFSAFCTSILSYCALDLHTPTP